MAFPGLGSGTELDPFQIINKAGFDYMSNTGILDPVFTGTGINNIVPTGSYVVGGTSSGIFKVIIVGRGVGSITLNNRGTGYVVGDYVTINVGGVPATGYVSNVIAGGGVGYLNVNLRGAGYVLADNIGTTSTSGVGVGLTVNITTLTPENNIKWNKNDGTYTYCQVLTGTAQIPVGPTMNIVFPTPTQYIIGDQWVWTLPSPVYYFKLMNDLDFGGGLTASSAITVNSFFHKFDGNGKQITGFVLGINYAGWSLLDNSEVKNITFRVANVVNNNEYNKERIIFGRSSSGTRSNVSLKNVKVITSGYGQLYWFLDGILNSTCVMEDIILEGNISMVFTQETKCNLTRIKVLRTNSSAIFPYITPNLSDTAIMKWCQQIFLNYNQTVDIRGSLLVAQLGTTARIIECYIDGHITVTYPTLPTEKTFQGIASTVGNANANIAISDCLLKGVLSINGGENTNINDTNKGKSGYLTCASIQVNVQNIVSDIDLITPLNLSRPVFTKDTSTRISHCYYKRSTLSSLDSVDIANRQTGLSDVDYLDTTKFTGLNFTDVWNMTVAGPELKNNPIYAYETPLKGCQVISTTRISPNSFSILLNKQYVTEYGVDIKLHGVIVQTKATINSTVLIDPYDNLYTLAPFYMDGVSKVYTTPIDYLHYADSKALMIPVDITPISIKVLEDSTPLIAVAIHGSVIYNDYIYGSSRNDMGLDGGTLGFNKYPATITKTSISDIQNTILIPITVDDKPWSEYTRGTFLKDLDQIVECKGNLYALGNAQSSGNYLIILNPNTDQYKTIKVSAVSITPIVTDGIYLYFCSSNRTVIKVNPDQFLQIQEKYNNEYVLEIDAIYHEDSQGAYSIDGYEPSLNLKGLCHSACCDSEYLYMSYTTSSGTDSGYYAPLDISCHEVHKIRKSDMTGAGWSKIPKSTDDMAQTLTHLFYGIEVQPLANPKCYGYGWGMYAVRKSDMHILPLPRLNSLDNPPTITSYGSLIFGDYLFDIKTNQVIYVVDISQVDDWSLNENIGSRLVTCFKVNSISNGIINELLLGSDGSFLGFVWNSYPSKLVKFDLPLDNIFIEPIVSTLGFNDLKLSGYIQNSGNKTINSRGFKYGLSPDTLTNTILSTDETNEFSVSIPTGIVGLYYFQAFATNSEGEGLGEIVSTTIANNIHIYLGSSQVQKIYSNGVDISNII